MQKETPKTLKTERPNIVTNVESNGEDNISGREAANISTHYDVQSDVVPDVLKFHDVGYLEFDEVTKLPKVPQSLRDELITLGPILFQHTDNLPSLYGERSITSVWFKRGLANGEEVNRSWLLYSPINKAASVVYYLHHRLQTRELRLS